MKPNKPLETFENRVAQFEKSENAAPASICKYFATPEVANENANENANPYLAARQKVLKTYSEETLSALAKMEKTGDCNNRTYEHFVIDVLVAAGDVPTHELRKRNETCGCASCKYSEEKLRKKLTK